MENNNVWHSKILSEEILEAQLPNAKEKLISIREAFGQSLLDLGRKNKIFL